MHPWGQHALAEAALRANEETGHRANLGFLTLHGLQLRMTPQAAGIVARLLAVEAASAGDVEAGHHAVANCNFCHARSHRLHRPHELRTQGSGFLGF